MTNHWKYCDKHPPLRSKKQDKPKLASSFEMHVFFFLPARRTIIYFKRSSKKILGTFSLCFSARGYSRWTSTNKPSKKRTAYCRRKKRRHKSAHPHLKMQQRQQTRRAIGSARAYKVLKKEFQLGWEKQAENERALTLNFG